jgi:hypothetical protein
MSDRLVIIERLQKKEAEIQSLEEKIRAARIYVQALQDVLNVLEKDGATSTADTGPRRGSAVTQAREIISKSGKPVHINELLNALGKLNTRENRASLTSALAAYVRRGEIFTRPAPNTFGLIELGHTERDDAPQDELPSDFGRAQPATSMDDEIPF